MPTRVAPMPLAGPRLGRARRATFFALAAGLLAAPAPPAGAEQVRLSCTLTSRGGLAYPLRLELDTERRAARFEDGGTLPAEPAEDGLLLVRFASLAGPSLLRLDLRRGEVAYLVEGPPGVPREHEKETGVCLVSRPGAAVAGASGTGPGGHGRGEGRPTPAR
jgi:hypothetical protein